MSTPVMVAPFAHVFRASAPLPTHSLGGVSEDEQPTALIAPVRSAHTATTAESLVIRGSIQHGPCRKLGYPDHPIFLHLSVGRAPACATSVAKLRERPRTRASDVQIT